MLSRSFLIEGGCRCKIQDFPARCTCSTASNVVPYKCPLYSICSINCLLLIPPEFVMIKFCHVTAIDLWEADAVSIYRLKKNCREVQKTTVQNSRQTYKLMDREIFANHLRSISGRVTNTRSRPLISACLGDRVVCGMGDA